MAEKTLRAVHKQLNVKQTLKIYVNNTNAKYKENWKADTILSDVEHLMVVINTLSKHRKHEQQMDILGTLLNESRVAKTRNKALKMRLEREEQRADKGAKAIKKDGLKTAYIETLELYSKWLLRRSLVDDKLNAITEEIKQLGLPYVEYMNDKGIEAFFNGRVRWFKDQLGE